MAASVWLEMYTKYGRTDTGQVPCPNVVLRRRCVDARRVRYTQAKYDQAKVEEYEPDLRHEEIDLCVELFSKAGLTSREQNLMQRRFVLKQKVKDIATELGSSEDSTRTEIFRALEKLRSAMRSSR